MSAPVTVRLRRTPTVVAVLHTAAAGAVIAVVAGATVQSIPVYLGIVVTSYALGLRHAFDADHIAVIDNATRRLVALGRPGRGIGLWFSLGHSTIVVAMCAVIAVGFRPVVLAPAGEATGVGAVAGILGPTVSGLVVIALALVNAVLLARSVRRTGAAGEARADSTAGAPRGLWSGLLARAGWAVDRPWRMYLVGVAFGLGLDTATEVGLLAVSAHVASGQASGLPVLALPLCFAAGMSLLDAAQGATARRVYESHHASVSPSNLLLTGASALTALIVGSAEISATLSSVPPLAWLPRVDVNGLGLVLTALMLVVAGIHLSHRIARRPAGSGASRVGAVCPPLSSGTRKG